MYTILRYIKFFSIMFFVLGLFVLGFFKMNGELDDWLCDYSCENDYRYAMIASLEENKIVVGVFKRDMERCECYVIHKEIEELFRKEMDKNRYIDIKIILDMIKKLSWEIVK